MARYVAVALILIQLFSSGDAFQGLTRQWTMVGTHQVRSKFSVLAVSSEDLTELTVTELKTRLRTAGLPITGAKKDLIDRLQTPAAAPAEVPAKKTTRLGGLLLRRKVKTPASSDEVVETEKVIHEKKEEKVEEFVMPVIAVKKASPPAPKPVVAATKQWESRKSIVEKTPAVEVKKVSAVLPSPVVASKIATIATPVIDSKKPIKSVKQVVAAYDIDDDDFMDQFMDKSGQPPAQRSAASTSSGSSSSSTSSFSSGSSSSSVSTGSSSSSEGSVSDGRQAWPGPGVSWMPGPQENNSKKDQNRGRNALMAAADDDLQRMVDQRNDARYKRDYDGADAIREELRTIYRVEIYDKLGEWVAADGRWGLSNRKRGAGTEDGVPVMAKIQTDAKPCTLTYEEVMDQVIKRTTARRTRQFQVADDIRDELARVGVELFDKVNEWRTYDGQMRGIQSEDFEKYEVKKDNERYDRGNSRDKVW